MKKIKEFIEYLGIFFIAFIIMPIAFIRDFFYEFFKSEETIREEQVIRRIGELLTEYRYRIFTSRYVKDSNEIWHRVPDSRLKELEEEIKRLEKQINNDFGPLSPRDRYRHFFDNYNHEQRKS